MSYEYNTVDNTGLRALGVMYLIFGIGCLIFFFGGICALLCCCNQKFRGIERKGYVIREAEQSAPLILPSVQGPGSTVPLQNMPYPGGPPAGPGWVAPSYPQDPPPKY